MMFVSCISPCSWPYLNQDEVEPYMQENCVQVANVCVPTGYVVIQESKTNRSSNRDSPKPDFRLNVELKRFGSEINLS